MLVISIVSCFVMPLVVGYVYGRNIPVPAAHTL